MADNYLERRMEDYRNGNLSKHKSVNRHSKQHLYMLLAPPSELTATIMEELKSMGKIIWCGDRSKSFREMSQKHGVQLFPQVEEAMKCALEIYQYFDAVICIGEVENIIQIVDSTKQIVCVICDKVGKGTFDLLKNQQGITVTATIFNGDLHATSALCKLLTLPQARYLNHQCLHPSKI